MGDAHAQCVTVLIHDFENLRAKIVKIMIARNEKHKQLNVTHLHVLRVAKMRTQHTTGWIIATFGTQRDTEAADYRRGWWSRMTGCQEVVST